MNCPAKTEPIVSDGHNQNPNDLAADLTTNSDLGKIANARGQQDHKLSDPKTCNSIDRITIDEIEERDKSPSSGGGGGEGGMSDKTKVEPHVGLYPVKSHASTSHPRRTPPLPPRETKKENKKPWHAKAWEIFKTYLRFVGPGMMISVAYIDPGNYATDVQAGATYRFKLLFIVLLSNIFAIVLQSLCIKLGTVTGLSMPQMIRAHWPPWLNLCWFLLSVAAIEATDVAEVIGTAIALNLLSNGKLSLIVGCALCPLDVFFILVLYRSSKASIRARQVFEFFIALLVIGVAVSFGIQLSYIKDTTVGEVFMGFVPSSDLVQQLGLYLSCGIVGATVMPHSLILGSGLVQNRLEDFDAKHNLLPPSPPRSNETAAAQTLTPSTPTNDSSSMIAKDNLYRPSLRAIRNCIWYSIADNFISLFTFALFVNSAILIVAGASLDTVSGAANASLFGIYTLLQTTLGLPVATMFAVALLLSGISAGIVVTMAGQVAFEGHLNRTIAPWKLRLMIRSISVPISMAVAGTLGKKGLNTALVGSQVTLCVLLPCIAFPLAWFTCQSKFMTVTTDARGRRVANVVVAAATRRGGDEMRVQREGETAAHGQVEMLEGGEEEEEEQAGETTVNMRNHFVTSFFVIVVWLVVAVMNVAMLVLIGLGKA